MSLIEVIPGQQTDPAMLDNLETWLVARLGKNIVRAKDTQSFVANRIGLFSILAVMHHAKTFGLGLDVVDVLTGRLIGHPASGTFRTADMIGLDTLATVMDVQHRTLPEDPWRDYFKAPDWFAGLIAKGALGLKTKGGIYRKVGKDIQVLDLALQDYKPSGGKASAEVSEISRLADPAERFARLRASNDPQAQFLWAMRRDVFHYCAYHLAGIADNARDVDFAMRWGWAWAAGPFELWQSAGWKAMAEAIQQDIDAGKAMVKAPLPAWVMAREGVYQGGDAYSPAEDTLKPRSTLPIYQRQLFPDPILGETFDQGETLLEDDSVRLWRMPKVDGGIAILSFKSKMHALAKGVIDGIYEAVAQAEADFDGLVIWHPAPFGVGANLTELSELTKAGKWDEIDRLVAYFQGATKALRHAQVPTVAAVDGMAFGGGAEVAMHCAHRVLALESQMGLVEAGVGLNSRRRRMQGDGAARVRRGAKPHSEGSLGRHPKSVPQYHPWRRLARGDQRPRDGLCAERRYGAVQRARGALRRDQAGARTGRRRLSPAAGGAPDQGHRRARPSNSAHGDGQHARGRLHERA